MSDYESKTALTRMQIDMIRGNVNAFIAQSAGDTTRLMPFMPKRLLAMVDTLDALHEQIESLKTL